MPIVAVPLLASVAVPAWRNARGEMDRFFSGVFNGSKFASGKKRGEKYQV